MANRPNFKQAPAAQHQSFQARMMQKVHDRIHSHEQKQLNLSLRDRWMIRHGNRSNSMPNLNGAKAMTRRARQLATGMIEVA